MTHSLTLHPQGGSRLPDIRQAETAECDLACLAMILGYHGRHIDLATLRRWHPISVRGASLRSVMSMAAELDLAARPLRLEMDHLCDLKTPAILHWDMDHFVVLRRATRNGLDVHDPATGARHYTFAEAGRHFTGVALELTPTQSFSRASERSRLRLRDILIWPKGAGLSVLQALLLSVLLQVYVIASPFYMQIAMDDAVAQNDHDLLTVLAVGFGLFLSINVGAGLLRSLALVHLQTGLAYELSAAVLRHLLRLPLDYFEKRRTGDLLSRFAATRSDPGHADRGRYVGRRGRRDGDADGGADLRLQPNTRVRRHSGFTCLYCASDRDLPGTPRPRADVAAGEGTGNRDIRGDPAGDSDD